MGRLRWIGVGLVIGATLALPVDAAADGGAYIEASRTYYVQGGTGSAQTFVAIPEKQQDILQRGPFFAYLVPEGIWLREGRPLPHGTIRLGTFSVEDQGRNGFALRVTFVVPQIESGTYSVQLCNEPCTVAGFREPLTGTMMIAASETEARLVSERNRLEWRVASLRRSLERRNGINEELMAQLDEALAELDDMSLRVAEIQPGAVALVPTSTEGDRPLVEAWALLALVGALLVALVAVALGLIFSRRHAVTLVVPDTIAELDEEMPELEEARSELVRR